MYDVVDDDDDRESYEWHMCVCVCAMMRFARVLIKLSIRWFCLRILFELRVVFAEETQVNRRETRLCMR